MAFKDLHKLKKVIVVEKEFIKSTHLVVGKDIFALSLYKKLQEKYGVDQVRLLSGDPVLKSDLLPKGPSTLRGKNNQDLVRELYPNAIGDSGSEQALFYKDMSFKSFGGRSKPEALKFNEEFYCSGRFDIKATEIFSELNNAEEFIETINKEAYQVKVKSIHRSGDGFKVECLNGTEFECEKLYFGQSPYQYLQLYTEKNQLSDKFIEFCESTKTPSALFVKFVFDKPITDIKETLFIPLSYTHEWGHFVGEFNDHNGEQMIEFIHFLDEDQASEEDISRTIRLLKKNLEKIFEKYSSIKHTEYIVLEQEIGCLNIDDKLFITSMESSPNDCKNLFLVGINAPIAQTQCEDISFEYSNRGTDIMARALLVQSLITKKI